MFSQELGRKAKAYKGNKMKLKIGKAHEVKLSKKNIEMVRMRSAIPPNSPEMGVRGSLYSPESYANYGNDSSLSTTNGNSSIGSPPGGSGE
jgi:hypothetical protein